MAETEPPTSLVKPAEATTTSNSTVHRPPDSSQCSPNSLERSHQPWAYGLAAPAEQTTQRRLPTYSAGWAWC
jgi:hypothetical protein